MSVCFCEVPLGPGPLNQSPSSLSRLGEIKAQILLRGQGPLSSVGGWLTHFCQNCLKKQPAAHVHWDNLTWSWKAWLNTPDTFLHLQRTVSQEALEPHLPLPHQCGWGSVNPTSSFSFLVKQTLGTFYLPPRLEHTASSYLAFFHLCSADFQIRIGCYISLHLEENVSCQYA